MPRLLLDQSAPKGIRHFLPGYETKTAYEMGWDRLANGNLLTAAEEAGFTIMVSADQNIWHQVQLVGRRIALVVLGSNHWGTVKAWSTSIVDACDRTAEGSYIVIPMPKPPRIRRQSMRPGP